MTRDDLDQAIDAVAARLTRVVEDDALAARIANALPERSPWLLRSWIPRLAITAGLAALAIAVVLRTFDERSTNVLRTENAGAPFVELRAAVEPTAVEPEPIGRRTTVERSSNFGRTTEDFERSLAAIAAPKAIVLSSLSPEALEASEGLVLAPLRIADLPLTAENDFPY